MMVFHTERVENIVAGGKEKITFLVFLHLFQILYLGLLKPNGLSGGGIRRYFQYRNQNFSWQEYA